MEIVVRMLGGLGNQLFQYAYARYLSTKNEDYKIYLDIREYNTYKVRNYDLDLLKLNDNIFKFDKKQKKIYDLSRKVFHIYQYIYRKINNRPLGRGMDKIAKLGYLYSGIDAFDEINIKKKEIYMYGYFQDVRIVNPIRDILLEELSYTGKLSSNAEEYFKLIKKYENTLAISIRCGQDYIKSGWPVCSIEYYKNALNIFKKRNENYKVFIFADDIQIVKEQFGFGDDVVYIENCSAIESLELLKRCDDFIISNSSFSWWGAYLSDNNNKLIIAPKKWFIGLDTIDTPLFLEREMMIVE